MKASFIGKTRGPVSFQTKLLLSYIMIIIVPVLSALLIYGVNLYNQTKSYYEDFLHQLNNRTNVNVNDFISNIARNSFFYLTDPKLSVIITKNVQLESKEYVEDSIYMQRAMDQLVVMNGNIAAISMMAPNRRIYGSVAAFEPDMEPIIQSLNKQALQQGKFVISAPYISERRFNTDKLLSIVRYLKDINLTSDKESYTKIDIKFKSLENILGSSESTYNEVGTIVLLDGSIIYQSQPLDESENKQIEAIFASRLDDGRNTFKLNNGDTYLFSSTINDWTGWQVIHYVPTRLIDQTFIVNTRNYMLLSLFALIAAGVLALFFSRRFIKPIHKLNKAMKLVDSGNYDVVAIHENRTDEIGRLVGSYNDMIHRLKESRETEIISSQLQKRAEMNMLQAQINPHFLYNTLNAIHSIAELHRVGDISTMAKSLSSMYRYNIKTGDESSIERELEQIKHYIHIQQIRFLGKFQVEYRVDEELLPCRILKFLLQPLVENAFYHGLEPKGGKGKLAIIIEKRGQLLFIRVEDDGLGMSVQKLAELKAIFEKPFQAGSLDARDNFGLRNVNARIKHFYGENYWIAASLREQGGTAVELAIPIVKGSETA
ncbi:sensor histidine kinase [Paenibacillus thalictri]|uniref:Sensor histidine kinase n=1 Tax=Paenibacillus thalictri TaxID=2527873 RepID=A0A4Q9DT17_9BACL|nr:sensor histidine kinase [Paenibacillus thalictri]TBL78649.1 sensor histidine kinase [Paenibacillus thalictri]